MEHILIVERQPVLRLGLRLFLTANLKTVSLHEVSSVSQLPSNQEGAGYSAVILGFRSDNGYENIKEMELLRQRYPVSRLIAYTDYVGQHKLFRKYLKGIKAIVSKQEDNTKLLRYLIRMINDHDLNVSAW